MSHPPFPILFEDNHLLVVLKPAELPTMGVAAGRPSLLSIAKQYIKQKYSKPGEVYLGIVSRLDAPVTGILLLARTSKAASRLTEQFRKRQVTKRYWALIEPHHVSPSGHLHDWVRKDERHRKVLISNRDAPDAQEASASARMISRSKRAQLIEIELETGRKHQIRVQLSSRKAPILGDRKYGSHYQFSPGIALHARQLKFIHPVKKISMDLVAPLPDSWRRFVGE